MPRRVLLVALTMFTLAACKADRAPAATDAVKNPPTDQPAETAPPEAINDATVPPPANALAPSGPARMDGYGELDFGMTAEEAKAAWTQGKLEGAAPKGDPEACFFLGPAGQPTVAHLAFMFENDLFVRYSAENDDMAAPGGGRRGMTEAELQKLYANALKATPHKYVEGGKYLAIEASGVAPSKLVFETGADGKVTGWRVGVTPQVDYVEGCS
jgi:hypothetical protein